MEKRIITSENETHKILELVTDCNINLRWLHMKYRNGEFENSLTEEDIIKIKSLILATHEFLEYLEKIHENRDAK